MLSIGLALLFALSSPGDPAPDDAVRLDFPDSVELKVVVDYVASSLHLNVIYAEEILANKKVSVRVSGPIARASLEGLLRTLLRSRGLALVPAEQPGWLKVVALEQLANESGPLQRGAVPVGTDDTSIITQSITAEHVDVERLKAGIAAYLSKPGGTLLAIPESRTLIVTDFARNIRRINEVVALLDTEPPTWTTVTIAVHHQEADSLAAAVTKILIDRARARSGSLVAAGPVLSLHADPLGRGVIAFGPAELVDEARSLIEQFDVPIARRTELYQPKFIAVSRLKAWLEQIVAAGPGIKLASDDAANVLVATAPDDVHAQLRSLIAQFDKAPPESATPLRFYKLLNRRADDAYATLGALLGGTSIQPPTASAPSVRVHRDEAARLNDPGHTTPPMLAPSPIDPVTGSNETASSLRPAGIQGPNFSLSVDEHTNSILAIATPELHQQIEQIVQRLDQRRPQVLVEVTLVSVSVDDGLSLGTELESLDLAGQWGHILFTSFGMSQVNPTTGQRRLIPATGGSGALLGPDEVPIILQALETSARTRVYSAPRILVDDNAAGQIESVAESPYTSVNASSTVATTSFAGFAKAGTQLTIEPHIAQGDHLEIKYGLTVSSFTGAAAGGAPPPRSSDTLSSTIRVPDAYTVIVGGLLTETLGESESKVPLVGDIPLVGWLLGARSQSRSKVRLYAFIRPTIMRHEEFEDLKYISDRESRAAELPERFPSTHYQYMR